MTDSRNFSLCKN